MRECRLQQVLAEGCQVLSVSQGGIWHLRRVEQRRLDDIGLHQLEHASEKHTLQLEAAFVVGVCQDEEDVLHDAREVGLEKAVADGCVCTSEVVDDFQTY